MIIPNNTQILTDEGKLTIAIKEQEGTIVATGGASDITCLVDDGAGNKDLAVKVFAVEGDSVADSNISTQVLTSENELAIATTSQDGNVLTGHSATDKTCLVETETGKQTALKVFALDGTILATDGNKNTTCLVQDANGKAQLALKVFGSSADWKGKPSDWSDIRKDCPENSIALYAGHTALGGALPYTKVGTPTITGSIYTSSDSNYLIAKDCPKYCTFVAKITTGADVNSWQYVLSSEKLFDITIENGYLRCYKFNTAENIQLCAVSANTPYYIKAESYLDSEYNMKQFSVSLDGTDWTYGTANFVDNAPDDVNDVYVGRHLSVDGYYFKGSFDLSDTYVKNTDDTYFIEPYVAQTIQYDNLGFTATCTGGYKVYIDETVYGSYASGSKCSITWSNYSATQGEAITTPSALTAHKIWIEPATAGNNITAFRCNRVAASGNEEQGVLWAHFNIDNAINLASLFQSYQAYQNSELISCTAKNNVIKVSSLYNSFAYCSILEYAPVFDFNNQNNISFNSAFAYVGIEELTFKNGKTLGTGTSFFTCTKLKKIKGNAVFTPSTNAFAYCYALEELPNLDFSPATNLHNFAVSCKSLKDTILDTRAGTGITKFGFYGDYANNRISGLKGLRVSNEAPFNNATAPQINVSYTGMDRNALVQLFNDLPTVSAGQIINILGTTGAGDLTAEDEAIATAKGWTITK